MGLLFPDKMKTLLLVHRGDRWLQISSVVSTVTDSPHPGFFTSDDQGRSESVSPPTVRRALSDAKFWSFLETTIDKSRLTERGIRTKRTGQIDPTAMESAVADTLEEKTKSWTNGKGVMDLNQFLNELQTIPDTVIPTPDWLWSVFTVRYPEIFRPERLSRARFRQLLLLLGRNGTSTLNDVPMRGYFLPKDPRLARLLPVP
jgi:hypothetical protein